jgi:hypothetical protein
MHLRIIIKKGQWNLKKTKQNKTKQNKPFRAWSQGLQTATWIVFKNQKMFSV